MIESLSALNQHKILGHLKTDIIIYNLTNISNSIGSQTYLEFLKVPENHLSPI